MKNKAVVILSWLLVLITVAIIFSFSFQDSTSSLVSSEDVASQVLSVVKENKDITPRAVRDFQFPIRKIAHFGIYMLLGFTIISAVEKTLKLKKILIITASELICIIIAISDEIIQIFREGRTAYYVDSIIDSVGAVTGIFFYVFIIYLCRKAVEKSENKKDKQTN